MRRAFAVFDDDGSGRLDARKLSKALRQLGVRSHAERHCGGAVDTERLELYLECFPPL